jgi:hypothetical protein
MWILWMRDLALCFFFVFVVWLPLGRWLIRRIGGGNLYDTISLAVSLGAGVWGLIVLVLGSAGLLHVSSLAALFVLLFVALRLDLRFRSPASPGIGTLRVSGGDRFFLFAFAAVAAAFGLIAFASSLAPELSFDALNVHLPYARESAASGRLDFSPNNWSSAMPALPLMTYATAFLLSGVTLAKLTNLAAYFACGAWIHFMLKRWYGSLHGRVGAALFLSSPIAAYEATTALIDLPLALYSSIVLLALVEWTRSHDSSWLRLSAVALGFALSCKYHAAFWLAPVGLIVVGSSLLNRKAGWSGSLRTLALYGAIVFLLFAPWLFRAWRFTGNPVFPIANRFFESPLFTLEMEIAARAAYANEGVGTGLPALLQLPWTVTIQPEKFRGTIGAIFFLGTIAALARFRLEEIGIGLVAAAFYFYSWALTAQEIRYLLPLVPLAALLTTVGVLGRGTMTWGGRPRIVGQEGFPQRGILSRLGLILLLAGCLANLPGLYPRWTRGWTYWHGFRSPVAYLLGRESGQDFVRRDVPSIDVYEYINRNLTKDARVLLLNDAAQFYSRIPTLYSFTVEGEQLALQESEEGVLERLVDSGISHVLLNYNGIAPLPGVAPRRGIYFFLEEGFREKYLDEVFSSNRVVLFKVRI